MANTTSQSYSFDQDFSIDEIIARCIRTSRFGLQGTAGHQIKNCKKIIKHSFSRMG